MLEQTTFDSALKLDWGIVQQTLEGLCQTLYGRQHVQKHLFWCHSRAQVMQRYALVEELQSIDDAGHPIPVGAVTSAEEVLQKCAERSVLELDDLRDMRDLLLGIRCFREAGFALSQMHPLLKSLMEQGPFPELLTQRLEDAFDQDGSLSERCYPRLSLLRNRIQELRSKIDAELNRLLNDPALSKMLQESFVTQRNGRYVLPLKANFHRQFGIVHGRSQSGETLFVEPLTVLPLANALTEAELALEQLIHQICRELSHRIFQSEDQILALLEGVAEVDCACAIQKLGKKWAGVRPEIGSEGKIHLEQARHPVLALQGNEVVPNNFHMDVSQPVILLSGPNAGGKTIGLKLLGLMALLVRAGIPIPAQSGARCDFFDLVQVDIGDTQQVEAGLSTFSAKLLSLKEIILAAKENGLVLLDELGMGTDPAQGAAIAQAIIEELVERGARVVVTTHFTRLKAQADVDPRFQIAAAQFRSGQPTYQLEWGMIGQSYALDVAARMGLPERVLSRARGLLSIEERGVAELAAELATRSAELERSQEELVAALEAVKAKEQELNDKVAAVEDKRRQIKAAVHRDFQEQVWDEYRSLQETIKVLKSEQNIAGLRQGLRELEQFQQAVSTPKPAPEKTVSLKSVGVGQKVFVPSMGTKGEVLSVNRNRVMVQVNNMRVQVRLEELSEAKPTRASKGHKQKSDSLTRATEPHRTVPPLELTTPRSDDNTCDLRGLRVDEAVTKMEHYFSVLIGQGDRIAYLLHGHGTGRLKAGIRSYLPSCALVLSWRPAEHREGGDAFTRVELT